VRGRPLSETEVETARKVVVVNQAFVERYFGREDPIGRQVKFMRLENMPEGKVEDATFEIVGVVSDAKNRGIEEKPAPEAFMPYGITGAFERGVLIRTAGDPLALIQPLRREIWAVDRNAAITLTDTLTNFLQQFTYAAPRFTLLVLGAFAAVGLLLVALGIYSVVAYTVSRQTHEIGIRMALGATRADVLSLIMRGGLQWIGLGVVAGVATSLAATRVLQSHLSDDVPAHDPLTFLMVIAVVLAVGVAACFFPARRATRVNPIVALRTE
jgi:putative ABC transport system permease protein